MNTTPYRESALFEHRFWLQILGDHARFMLESLSPLEAVEVQQARQYVYFFDQLLATARETADDSQLAALTQQAFAYANDIRAFKLHLLRRHLEGELQIGLTPTFLNHMVNEVEEYLRILASLMAGDLPPLCHPLYHHLLWLPDASGHADAVESALDMAEKRLRKKSGDFAKQFAHFQLKASELAGYLRTNLPQFPALTRFNSEVELEIRLFQEFLKELEELEMEDKLLGSLNALLPDHMYREECYYLTKLAQVSEIASPPCDPTQPQSQEPE